MAVLEFAKAADVGDFTGCHEGLVTFDFEKVADAFVSEPFDSYEDRQDVFESCWGMEIEFDVNSWPCRMRVIRLWVDRMSEGSEQCVFGLFHVDAES